MKRLVALAVLLGAASSAWALQQYGGSSSGGGGGGDILKTMALVLSPAIFSVTFWSLISFDSYRREHHERKLEEVKEALERLKRNVFELKVSDSYNARREEMKKLKSMGGVR